MPPKLSFSVVHSVFESRGYTLLETIYIGKDVPMRYRCPFHLDAELTICYNSLRSGNGCRYCAAERAREKLKLPFDMVRHDFEEAGYTLLSSPDEYQNAHNPLRYRCPAHPKESLKMTYSNLSMGKRCRLCRDEETSLRLTTPIDEVRALFTAKGFEMLDHIYTGRGKIRFRCPIHPDKKNATTLSGLKTKKHICPYCAKLKVDFEDIKQAFSDRQCLLLEESYINVDTPMHFRCLFHPENVYTITYDKFRMGQRGCHKCAGFHYATLDEVRAAFEVAGYELLESEYRGADYKLRYRCSLHPDKETSMPYRKLQLGRRCPFCVNLYYTGEGDVKWKGGISKINDVLRQAVAGWSESILLDHDYRCAVIGKGGRLDAHHLTIPFHKLRDEVLSELGFEARKLRHEFSDEELGDVIDLFCRKHENVKGVALLEEIHDMFHNKFGMDASEADFYLFKVKYLAGEYDTHVKRNKNRKNPRST